MWKKKIRDVIDTHLLLRKMKIKKCEHVKRRKRISEVALFFFFWAGDFIFILNACKFAFLVLLKFLEFCYCLIWNVKVGIWIFYFSKLNVFYLIRRLSSELPFAVRAFVYGSRNPGNVDEFTGVRWLSLTLPLALSIPFLVIDNEYWAEAYYIANGNYSKFLTISVRFELNLHGIFYTTTYDNSCYAYLKC